MRAEQQIEEIMDYCREILKAKGKKRIGVWKKYLWKIYVIVVNLKWGIEDDDIKEEDLR